MSSIKKSDFHAALNRLESMTKSGATQLFHTSSDSAPGQHAGTSTSDYQDEHNDGIDENGTDYDGVKKSLAAKVEKSQALTPAEVAIIKGQDPRPAIAQKVASGASLTPAESWVVKGGYDKMKKMGMMHDDEMEMASKGGDKPGPAMSPGEQDAANKVPDTHAGENEQDEIEHDAKKSFNGAVAQSANLSKGIEMSPILAEFARAMGEGLAGVSSEVRSTVAKSLGPVVERVAALEATVSKSINEQAQYNAAFAETVVGIGQHVAGQAEVQAQQATLPAAAPKSQLRSVAGGQGVQAVSKSFGPGGLDTGAGSLAKSQITGALVDLVKANKIDSLDVVKFEATGEISPQLEQMALNHINGQG